MYFEDTPASLLVESTSISSPNSERTPRTLSQVSNVPVTLDASSPSLVQHDALPKITKVLVCKQESCTPAGPPAMNPSDCGTGPPKSCPPPLDSGRQQRTSSAQGDSKRATD